MRRPYHDRAAADALAIMSTDDATAELKPFLLLAKSAKGAAAASLISQVLEHPSVFVFGELLMSRA